MTMNKPNPSMDMYTFSINYILLIYKSYFDTIFNRTILSVHMSHNNYYKCYYDNILTKYIIHFFTIFSELWTDNVSTICSNIAYIRMQIIVKKESFNHKISEYFYSITKDKYKAPFSINGTTYTYNYL